MSNEEVPLLGPERNISTIRNCLNQLSDIEVKRTLKASPRYLIPLALGVASATLFWPASKAEIFTESGKWLAEHLGIDSPLYYFASAAPDLIILGYFLGRNFTAIFKEAYNEQDTADRKALLLISVGLLTAYQSLQTVAITYGAGGDLINILLATAGQLPNSAWSAVNIVTKGSKKAHEFIHDFKLFFYSRFIPTQIHEYDQEIIAKQLIKILRKRVMVGFKRHDFKTIKFDQDASTLLVLQTLTANLRDDEIDNGSRLGSASKMGLQSIGFIIASLILLGIVLNFVNFLRDFLGNLEVAWTFGLILCVGSIFTLNHLNIGATGQIYDFFNAKINGHNYWSPVYHLFPKLILFLIALATVLSCISYPTIKALISKNYHGPAALGVLVAACFSSVFFHIVGNTKGCSLTLVDIAKHKPTAEARSIFRVHSVLEELENNPKRVLKTLVAPGVTEDMREQILGRSAAPRMEELIGQGFFASRRAPQVIKAAAAPERELQQPIGSIQEPLGGDLPEVLVERAPAVPPAP